MSVCKQTPRKNVQLVNRPSENTAKVNETKGSENGNDADTHAAVTAQPQIQPRYPSRQRKAPQRLGFNTH